MNQAKVPNQSPIKQRDLFQEIRGNTLVHFRYVLIITLVLTVGALYQTAEQAVKLGVLLTSWKWISLLGVGAISVVIESLLLIATWTSSAGILLHHLDLVQNFLQRGRRLNLLVFGLTLGVSPLLVMGSYGFYIGGYLQRLFYFWCLGLVGTALLHTAYPRKTWSEILSISFLLHAAIYRIALFLPSISSFPFSLGYSEGSRYYFASMFFAERIYGVSDLGLPVLHPTRYILQSIPFFIPGLPLLTHRLWQVLLWIGMTIAAAVVLLRRVSIQDKFSYLLWLAWAFLFMFQGPVYYHLQVMVVIILWAVDSRKFLKTMIVVILASAWAGISRINWMPVPGLLAATLYFLERPKQERTLWRYLLNPFLWVVVGSIVAIGSHVAYINLSGSQTELFASSLNSPLLWYRLFPNATNKTGVLPAIMLASTSLFAIIVTKVFPRQQRWYGIRIFCLGSILAVLFIGGLVVSTKIGGGDDLHNLDAFLIHLVVIGTYLLFDRFVQDRPGVEKLFKPSWQLMSLVIAMPILFAISQGGPVSLTDYKKADEAISELQEIVAEAEAQGGEVLFVSERHLLAFDLIEGVKLIPEFEKTFLMEMAMSGNRQYLDDFKTDMEARRFALIIITPQRIIYKGRGYTFGEEDDAWVRNVRTPLLEYYQNKLLIDSGRGHIAVMEPIP